MIVPRSSTFIANDDEYSLFSVVVFKKVYDDFVNKCRENKYVIYLIANYVSHMLPLRKVYRA